MITVYLSGIAAYYEGEDIEVRYGIYNDKDLVEKKSLLKDYKKPAVVGPFALMTVLKELEKYKDEEITIIVNDPALNELIRGTSTTKNSGVLKMVGMTKDKLNQFEKSITIKDISTDKVELAKWNDILKL